MRDAASAVADMAPVSSAPKAPAPAAAPRPFFGRVEALRGLCAAMVAGWHMSGLPAPWGTLLRQRPWTSGGALQNAIGRFELGMFPGHAALMVFFTISGLVLRVSLQYGPQDFGRAAARFHIARLFRIYPVTLFALAVAALVRYATAPHGLAPPTLSKIIANLLMFDVSSNNTLWAIQLEVVMAPFIVLLWGLERRFGPRALIAIALITTPLAFGKWTFWPPLSEYFFAFVVGMLLPTVGQAWIRRLSAAAAGWWTVGALLTLFLAWPVFGFFSKFSAVAEEYAAAVLLCAIAYRTDLIGLKWMDWPFFRQLGRASGSYYVLHAPLLPLIFTALIGFFPALFLAQWPAIAAPLAVIACLVIFVPIAMLSYRLVEEPGIALGRRFQIPGA